MKRTAIIILILSLNIFGVSAQGPTDSTKRVFRVAVVAPLYLDSAFENNSLRYLSIPKFMQGSFEFVQGSMLALDSFQSSGRKIEAFIYDSKSAAEPLSSLILANKLDSMDLIIGAVRDDYKELTQFAVDHNTPFISATYPNDGGITANPYVVILNSTLRTHCEAIYNYIEKKYPTARVYIVKKTGSQENKIADYLTTYNEQQSKKLAIRTITIDSTTSVNSIKNKLDSNATSIFIGATFDEAFARKITDAAFGWRDKYHVKLVGMPNWEGFKIFSKNDYYKDYPVIFTSPYYVDENVEKPVADKYVALYKGKPSDMVYKGFSSTYVFLKLLLNHPDDLSSHLTDRADNNQPFDIKPVYLSAKGAMPDYFENKKVYIVKLLNGDQSLEQ